MRFGIIADDLTGSCDVAGRLTHLGYRPVVWVRPPESSREFSSLPKDSPIVVVNTRSRECGVSEAKSRARAAAQKLEQSWISVVFYKIDSTLRGHWAEELKVISGVARPDYVLVCPAFPAQGRRIEKGRLMLGVNAGTSLISFFDGSEEVILSERLWQYCRWRAVGMSRKVLAGGTRAVRKALDSASEPRCAIIDACNDNDLAAIGRLGRKLDGRILYVGSAGLAPHVFPRRKTPKVAAHSLPTRPWLLIQGSRRQISHEQFRRLAAESDLYTISFPIGRGRRRMQAWCDEAAAALNSGMDVAVGVPEDPYAAVARNMPTVFAGLFRTVLRDAELGGVFISGGATAEAVCDSLRMRKLQVTGEVAPGIPTSVALDGSRPGLRLVTKAGGFGGPEAVRKILEEYIRANR